MSTLRKMTLRDRREFVRKHGGRVRVLEMGMPDSITFDWTGLLSLIDEILKTEKETENDSSNHAA